MCDVTDLHHTFLKLVMLFTAILIPLLGCVAGDMVGLTVEAGSGSVTLPCHCVQGHSNAQVQTVVWWRINGETDEHIALGENNINDTAKLSVGYDFTNEHDLLIFNPDDGYSGTYICDVTWISNTSAKSEVTLVVSSEEDLKKPVVLHHYLVATIIVLLIITETTFILVLWLKLRKRKAKETPQHNCFGPLSFENGIIDIYNGIQANRGDNPDRIGRRLLQDELNEGPRPDGDSGFDDKNSADSTVSIGSSGSADSTDSFDSAVWQAHV